MTGKGAGVSNSGTLTMADCTISGYELDPMSAVPSTIDARLTINGTAGVTVTYDTSGMNPGDFVR